MNHKYDLFEKFPDGSSLWRECVVGLGGARLHMLYLARHSSNTFYALNVKSGKIVHNDHPQGDFHAGPQSAKHSRAVAA
jgi:hypothetical protein